MKEKQLVSSMLLLLTAAIWGLAFVAQRVGAEYVGAFTFNGVRFALGGFSLVPLLIYLNKRPKGKKVTTKDRTLTIKAGIIVGCVLFLGSSLQQIGLASTSAGKAAFITGLYIVLVPITGIFLRHRINKSTWVAVAMAIIGLYLLSVTGGWHIATGDLFEIAGAFLWAAHILVVDRYTKKVDGLKLSFVQSLTASILSLAAGITFEKIDLHMLSEAAIPILYGGICSVGIAYTLQIIGQKHSKPSHAAIILSMESVFASIGGLLMLHENLGARGYVGCALMFSGMLLSQLGNFKKNK